MARDAVEQVARECYAKVVAFLASRSGDLAAAQDAVGDAFVSALQSWEQHGVPNNPEAWMFTAARRKLIDARRRTRGHTLPDDEELPAMEATAGNLETGALPDERLGLLFACAHPAIDAGVRTPLVMNAVLGLTAERIASAFLIAPAAMSQRLVRAKIKIRDAVIPFAVPGRSELPARVATVLEAVYASFTNAWDDAAGADPASRGLGAEAVRLARLVARLLPEEPEAHGLLALMLFCESRRDARRSADGSYVPLSDQSPDRWSRLMYDEAEQELASAARLRGEIGRFQLEAAIQSAHMHRAALGFTPWDQIAQLYEGLVRIAPSAGALVGRGVAITHALGPSAGLAALDEISDELVAQYQPYWAARADVLARLGLTALAHASYTRAIGLSEDHAVRRFLSKRRQELDDSAS